MTDTIYISASEADIDKSAVALDLVDELSTRGTVAIFRPLVNQSEDLLTRKLAEQVQMAYQDAVGVTVSQIMDDRDEAIAAMINKFGALKDRYDSVVVVGTDFNSPMRAAALDINLALATHLNAPCILLFNGRNSSSHQIADSVRFACVAFQEKHQSVIAVLIEELPETQEDEVLAALGNFLPGIEIGFNALNPEKIIAKINEPRRELRTPAMFEYQITQQAKSDLRTIVLPESEDSRILEAAAITLMRGTANIILLGDPQQVNNDASRYGFDLSGAQIISMQDPNYLEPFAAEYAKLRAHKGVTLDQAREKMKDPSYFGTMMVKLGIADGMVSGASHTTANTIRPSLEFIKTKPGVKVVSGSFLMCLEDHVLVFADCAVNPNPTPEQIADIAITSAQTARSFNIDPKVALLSYSTGDSGAGVDVDAVKEATRILLERDPDFPVAGPIQFDAAIDPTVGKKKMPDNPVAGNATVFIFPDLNTGNNTYKAVQRTSGALAIGPVLQGLNKPVNDLSRGALVADIVNTIVITAIQAQVE